MFPGESKSTAICCGIFVDTFSREVVTLPCYLLAYHGNSSFLKSPYLQCRLVDEIVKYVKNMGVS